MIVFHQFAGHLHTCTHTHTHTHARTHARTNARTHTRTHTHTHTHTHTQSPRAEKFTHKRNVCSYLLSISADRQSEILQTYPFFSNLECESAGTLLVLKFVIVIRAPVHEMFYVAYCDILGDLLHTLLSCLLNQVWCVACLFLLESIGKSVYVLACLAWH